MKVHSQPRFHSLLCSTAVVAALAVLGGCASDGHVGTALGGTSSSAPGTLGGGVTGAGSQADAAINAGSAVLANVGATTSAVGQAVGSIPVGAATGLVSNTGNAISTLGQGVTAGLGNLSQPNAVGATVASVPVALHQVATGVDTVGAGTPLAPVTGTAGSLVNKTADVVAKVTQDGVVRKVTEGASTVVRRVDDKLITATQNVGDATGVGVPVNGLTNQIGNAVALAGSTLSGGQPNGVTSTLGATVGSVGGLVNVPGTTLGGAGGGAAGVAAPVVAAIAPAVNAVTQTAGAVVTPVVGGVVQTVGTVVAGVGGTGAAGGTGQAVGGKVVSVVDGTVGAVGGVAGGLISGLGLGARH